MFPKYVKMAFVKSEIYFHDISHHIVPKNRDGYVVFKKANVLTRQNPRKINIKKLFLRTKICPNFRFSVPCVA